MDLINRVANSPLQNINLESFYPPQEMVLFDIKDYLFMELILKEKDFRKALKEHDWSQYQNKIVLIICSADAIIPMWAGMLITSYASAYASDIFMGSQEEYLKYHYKKVIENLDSAQYENGMLVIKGCSDKPVPASAYVSLTQKLQPLAKSIMFGEPCSTVPVYKKKR